MKITAMMRRRLSTRHRTYELEHLGKVSTVRAAGGSWVKSPLYDQILQGHHHKAPLQLTGRKTEYTGIYLVSGFTQFYVGSIVNRRHDDHRSSS